MAVTYQEFIDRKKQWAGGEGFEPVWMPDFLKPFQVHLTDWQIRRGRGLIAADCGLGKTPMQLVWAENVVRHTNKRVLILTPLAVAKQTCREADKFGIEVERSTGTFSKNIVVTNYDQLHHFSPHDFVACVADESSCLKAMKGKTRSQVTDFMRGMQYRLLCTATAAPNDYVELGTSSEALGEMGQRDMITMFFKQETSKDYLGWGRTKYLLRPYAEESFWRWVSSWARACRRPSDLGFEDDEFILPELRETSHIVKSLRKRDGFLFDIPARNMEDEREERRRTIIERCDHVSKLVTKNRQAVIWCHLNKEGDLLAKLLPDGRQVRGEDSTEEKEEAYEAFEKGQIRHLIIKPKIGAWGLNWQFCHHIVTFSSHSYEQDYQAIRRCWRFGQKHPVQVDRVMTEGEIRICANLARKSASADRMFTALVKHMNDSLQVDRDTKHSKKVKVPAWLP